MKTLILVVVLSVFAAVYCNDCGAHHDPSGCGITCDDDTMQPGCDGNVCTCVPIPTACKADADCAMETCGHHQVSECNHINECHCMKP